ncbi:MAG TPA: PAS domain S-box protein [Pseudolabrys sp.]|nr:PAS domain S-box protein [Pseudolabrys sp.]
MHEPFASSFSAERRLELLVEAVADYAIFLMDADGTIVSWNSGAQRIKGYATDEILGQHYSVFFPPEDRAAGRPQRNLAQATSEGKFEGEGWRLRKDGTRFWAHVVIHAIRDADGELIGFAKVTRDVTEAREAQRRLEEAREQLFQAQKMEAIGQLTGGVAHDFNNLLTIVLGGADMAERLAGDNEKLKRLIVNIRHAAKRGEALTRQLLAFSRRQPLSPERVDLDRQLNTVGDLLGRSLRGDISIVIDIPPGLWPIEVDAGQFELALLNVGLNARDAMPEGGTLRVSASNVTLDEKSRHLIGDFVEIKVSDTGIGMPDDVKERAFEPFFTTKEIGRGSGLGLSQAYGFARQSNGAVDLESAVGKGTTVTFYLPAAKSKAREALAPGSVAARPLAPMNILLVEDDLNVAETTADLLEGAGYKVTHVPDAQAALERLRGGGGIDLVFSDIMMPGAMNGADLARVVRAEFPGVFILLATGYAEAAATKAAQEFPTILKPYGRELLVAKLSHMLGEAE